LTLTVDVAHHIVAIFQRFVKRCSAARSHPDNLNVWTHVMLYWCSGIKYVLL